MTNLAADIGGTYGRPARSGNGLRGTRQVFRNGSFDSLEAVIDAGFLHTVNNRTASAITRFNDLLADWFEPACVVRQFCAKERMADIVTQIPEYHVTRHDTGLSGVTSLVKKISTGQIHEQQ